jgi:hypothetical protein|tara:strand:+ start:117 stop:488 length:372 start_codon:yes stop_codon:yes gene_type:complete
MGVKEILARISQKRGEKKQKFQQMEEDFMLHKKLEERQKSSNERELDKYMEEAREAKIKQSLESFRNKQRDDTWRNNSMLSNQTSILKDERPILKEKNIFMNKEKSMHFGKSSMLKGGTGWGW